LKIKKIQMETYPQDYFEANLVHVANSYIQGLGRFWVARALACVLYAISLLALMFLILSLYFFSGMKQDIAKKDLAQKIKTQGYITLYINFDVDKWTIRAESQPTIENVAKMLKDNPDLNLTIAGHTDSSGTWAYNKTLSENRAKAVLQALVSKGIATSRLSSVGYGQDKPIADNASEAGKAKNRRVELIKK
jgi:hypothetical protein